MNGLAWMGIRDFYKVLQAFESPRQRLHFDRSSISIQSTEISYVGVLASDWTRERRMPVVVTAGDALVVMIGWINAWALGEECYCW